MSIFLIRLIEKNNFILDISFSEHGLHLLKYKVSVY